jgi:hypothetical protein
MTRRVVPSLVTRRSILVAEISHGSPMMVAGDSTTAGLGHQVSDRHHTFNTDSAIGREGSMAIGDDSLLPSTPVSRLLVACGTPKTRLYQEHLAQQAPDLFNPVAEEARQDQDRPRGHGRAIDMSRLSIMSSTDSDVIDLPLAMHRSANAQIG